MSTIITVHQHGGPEVLVVEQRDTPKPGAGEVLIRQEAIGLNFIDVYFRTGLYPAPNGLPLTPGNEGAGVVLELGAGVTSLKVGDRVAYAGPIGAYAVERVLPADRLVILPDNIEMPIAAGMMLKGMTAEYLLRRTFALRPEHTLLFHAAAGGVGLIAGQWAKQIGATTIGTAGGAEKCALAKANGFDHVIDYSTEDVAARVRELTGGKGVDVVYDSVGKDTFEASLNCLRPRGMLVSFGQSSGAIPPVNLGLLSQKGSLYVTRPTLFTYIASRQELEESAGALFGMVGSGKVAIQLNQTYALADVAKAHADLEGRKTTGTTVLLP
jgi:NADPH2:quinone reductase